MSAIPEAVRPELTVVSPFFNEYETLPTFCRELRTMLDQLGCDYEVILVDDGSTDGSVESLKDLDWEQASILRFVKNEGHQTALDAGIRESHGAWVVTMDSDLQHPPALIPQLLTVARSSHVDVVYAARESRREDKAFKRGSASAYYRMMRLLTNVDIVPNAADFRLMSRRVVDVLNAIPEEKTFRVLLPYLGFPSATVNYTAAERFGGTSKYTLSKMGRLAVTSALSFSALPLRIIALSGLAISALALVFLIFVLFSYLLGMTVQGWASTASVVLLLGGLQLFSIGVLGLYVGRLYDASTGRPRYVVRDRVALSETPERANGR